MNWIFEHQLGLYLVIIYESWNTFFRTVIYLLNVHYTSWCFGTYQFMDYIQQPYHEVTPLSLKDRLAFKPDEHLAF